MSDRPLSGVRVLDLSRLLPGPYCTLLLADMGAEVIKIEDVGVGDTIRVMAPFVGGRSAYFLALNAGKKSLAVDLKAPAGREAFLKLAATASVVVEGFRPGTVDRLGVGYEAVKAVRPGIVYCSISGFGRDGPDKDRAGHDLLYLARAGILDLNGRPGQLPTIPSVQIADLGSAMYAAVGILAALRESERSGRGRFLDIGMMDSAMAWLVMAVAEHAAGEKGGRGQRPLTGKHPCYNVYRTRDGRDIALTALEPKFWDAFCRTMGRPDLRDRQFSEKPEDHAEFAALFAARTREEWKTFLEGTDFCCEVVPTLDEALSDPQVRHRAIIQHATTDGHPHLRVNHPLRAARGEGPAPCPEHGEHTFALLRELGYGDAELAGLEATGAVRGPRPPAERSRT
ncbi:MAG: CoA transferase [Candidatus Aminicenantes bacterium]|nr:CoA transferase [Candidatus Aminicenantes bacterium]